MLVGRLDRLGVDRRLVTGSLQFLELPLLLLEVFLVNTLLLNLILDLRLLVVVRVATGLLLVLLHCLLHNFEDVELVSFWQHLVEHSNLQRVCIDMRAAVRESFGFLNYLCFVLYFWSGRGGFAILSPDVQPTGLGKGLGAWNVSDQVAGAI